MQFWVGLLDDLVALLVSACKCIKNIWNTFTFIGKILRKRFLFCYFLYDIAPDILPKCKISGAISGFRALCRMII